MIWAMGFRARGRAKADRELEWVKGEAALGDRHTLLAIGRALVDGHTTLDEIAGAMEVPEAALAVALDRLFGFVPAPRRASAQRRAGPPSQEPRSGSRPRDGTPAPALARVGGGAREKVPGGDADRAGNSRLPVGRRAAQTRRSGVSGSGRA